MQKKIKFSVVMIMLTGFLFVGMVPAWANYANQITHVEKSTTLDTQLAQTRNGGKKPDKKRKDHSDDKKNKGPTVKKDRHIKCKKGGRSPGKNSGCGKRKSRN